MDSDNQCLSVFQSFINDIIKVYPEYKEKINETYGSVLSIDSCNIEENELLKEFLDRVHKLNKKITNKDESLFTEDNLILTNISSKELWTTNISYKTKETIWKYLQTFCLLSLSHQSNKELQSALLSLSQNKTVEIKDKKTASDVKKIKKMSENIKEPIAEEVPSSQPSDNPFSDMESLINGSEIGKIAQEVSESLDLESMLSSDSGNPMEMFQKLMSGDAMGKIMGTIHTVVSQKVESGQLNETDMVNEAKDIYGNMGTNPLFQAMAQQGQQQQQQQQHQQQQQNQPVNKTKARLQKKLKEKQKIQVNKVDN